MSIWRKVSWAFVHTNAVMKSFHATWCYDPGNISLKGIPEKSKFNANFFPLIQSKRKWLLQNFVHDMTLVLSCHLQKIVAICWPVIQLWISVFHLIWIFMEKHQWNDPMHVNRDIPQKLLEIYLIFCINNNAFLSFFINFSQNIYNKHAIACLTELSVGFYVNSKTYLCSAFVIVKTCQIRPWISNHINIKEWDIIIHLWLITPSPLNLVITFHMQIWIYYYIHALILINLC